VLFRSTSGYKKSSELFIDHVSLTSAYKLQHREREREKVGGGGSERERLE
jgi:hypothetical protein